MYLRFRLRIYISRTKQSLFSYAGQQATQMTVVDGWENIINVKYEEFVPFLVNVGSKNEAKKKKSVFYLFNCFIACYWVEGINFLANMQQSTKRGDILPVREGKS